MEDPRIIAYLFLGGLGAGACQVLAVLGLLCPRNLISTAQGRFSPRPEYRGLLGTGYAAASLALFLGVICLVADLGRPDRILTIVLNPDPTLVGIGAWSLGIMMVFALLLCAAWMLYPRVYAGVVKIANAVTLAIGLVVMVYTALLLGLFAGVPFWDNPCIVVLFVLSSLSTGCALVMLTARICRADSVFSSAMYRLACVDVAIVLAEAAGVACLVVSALLDVNAQSSAWSLLSGSQSETFWLGLVGWGIAIPLACYAVRLARKREGASAVIAILILIGGFCLRACIIGAGRI